MKPVQELAKDKANLFDGKYTQQFAPSSIQRNMKALEHGETAKALVKQDVIVKKEVAEPKVEKICSNNSKHIFQMLLVIMDELLVRR